MVVLINQPRLGQGGSSNVTVRGIDAEGLNLRNQVKVVEGRMFTPGTDEVIVARRMARRFASCGLGDKLRFGQRDFTVVGHFDAAGSAFEPEIWAENEQVMPVFRGEVFQSITFRLNDPAAFDDAKRALEADPRLGVDVLRESAFYAGQIGILGIMLRALAIAITSIMAVGAIFGAVNTMYAAVASRTSEIAVLLTVGFRPWQVLVSFLAESSLIALVGAVLGAVLALPVNGIVTSTTNWSSFSEIAFSFRITPLLMLIGIAFGVVMGVAGGFFPAWQAARLRVVEALR